MRPRVLRGALVGFGGVAANAHLDAWRARGDVAIVAACDASPARREAYRSAIPHTSVYETTEALLAGETLDFVDISTPPGSHARLIESALERRLHVLCEKPLATRLADAEAAARAASRAGRVLHTVHNWLNAPICRRISALLFEGAIGALRRLEWRTLRRGPAAASSTDANWRTDPALAGGGILVDHGWHALYCIARWMGRPPSALAATLEKRRYGDWAIEDTATLKLDFDAASAEIYLTWAADERANHLLIEGERGRISIAGANVILEQSSERRLWSCPPALSEGSHHPDWFAAVADDFIAAVVGGGVGNVAEALLCARLVDLAQRSCALGGARLPLVA